MAAVKQIYKERFDAPYRTYGKIPRILCSRELTEKSKPRHKSVWQ